MTTITLLPEHGYVLGVMVLTGLLAQYQAISVGGARKAAKVPYPNAYASHEEAQKDIKKYQFNCAQRAHANYLENVAIVTPLMIASAPVHPKATAILGGIWIVGRLVYAIGYSAGKIGDSGSGRYKGAFFYIGQFGLLITAGMSLWTLVV